MEQPNLAYIDQLADGDTEIKNKLIAIIKEEFPIEKENYLEQLKNGNLLETAELVHKIKHKINIFGLEESYIEANVFEKNLKNNSTIGQESFKQILERIESYIKTL